MGRDLPGSEDAGIFLFIEQPDFAYSNAVIIEIELFGGIDGMSDLDPLTDVGGGDFVEGAFEADGGVVIDDPFVAQEKDFIQFLSGEPSDQDVAHGGLITVDGSFLDAGVEFMVIIVLEPEGEGLVEFIESHCLLQTREEPFPGRPEEAFHLSAGGAVIGFGMDQGDTGLGAASGQQIRGEGRRIIAVKTLTKAVGQEGLLEDDG
jgi:hypothetical protein